MTDSRLRSAKALKARIKNSEYLTQYYKNKLETVLQKAIDFKLVKPNLNQQISDKFYEEKPTKELTTGDLVDLKMLNEKLTKAHKKFLNGKTFAEHFYPYFFQKYAYLEELWYEA